MKILFYKETPVELGRIMEIDGLKVSITQDLLDINPTRFSYKVVEYVKLTNTPPWSINSEFNGEVFELSTLNNLSKFQYAPSKENFLYSLLGWITIGSFKIATEEEFFQQEKNRLREEASRRGLLMKPRYLKYPWQNPSEVREPSWDGSGFTTTLTTFIFCGVTIYKNGEWAEIIKVKSLVDYELQLLKIDKNYGWLLLSEPKLYWTKIFSLIANDFNKTPLNILGTKYFVTYSQFNEPFIMKHETVNYGLTYFKSAGDALRAAELMGSKLEYIIPKK